MVDRYGVLSVQSVSHCTFNIEFVEHFVRILKVVRVKYKNFANLPLTLLL